MATTVITQKWGSVSELPPTISHYDEVELTADSRARGHQRVLSREGRELRISLERGSELDDGDVLTVDGDVAVVVAAAVEDVIEVAPRTELEWAIAAFVLGNLHRPVRFPANALLTPYEPSTSHALDAEGVPHTRRRRPFSGRRVKAFSDDSHD